MYTKTTQDIKVTVFPNYLEDYSDPDNSNFVWAYTIQLENYGKEPVTLIDRHWHITDAMGQIQEVKGEGVIGETPTIKPGEAYRYTSGVPLRTSSGIMFGSYGMIKENGNKIAVDIPAFSLDLPYHKEKLN